MMQAPIPIIAFGLFFTARFCTARYLLIDINDGAIGARAGENDGAIGARDGDGILDPFLHTIRIFLIKLYIYRKIGGSQLHPLYQEEEMYTQHNHCHTHLNTLTFLVYSSL